TIIMTKASVAAVASIITTIMKKVNVAAVANITTIIMKTANAAAVAVVAKTGMMIKKLSPNNQPLGFSNM
ncbi:MAG TPA: hypothetical protein IAC66_04205, partial [Candidatus Aphodousia gallistercoris]|nr:hypothetical protein [Candidatus Aphodousia gallistercoris]